MSIALIITDRSSDLLVAELLKLNKSLDIQVWPHINRPKDVHFAVLWKQPKDYLNQFPNLKAVTSLGAGVDFIESDVCLNPHTPIFRIVTNSLKQQMAQYILSYLLPEFRDHTTYEKQQKAQTWEVQELADSYTVGLLGLGEIGKFVAQQLMALGFQIKAWTRSQNHKTIPCFQGKDGLFNLVSSCDCVVGLLPLNQDTNKLLNLELFKHFKPNALLIQAGRGGQIIEKDLIQALDRGNLKKAVLDVFEQEPLSQNSPLWQHPKITITPHNSARSDTKQTAEKILELYTQVIE